MGPQLGKRYRPRLTRLVGKPATKRRVGRSSGIVGFAPMEIPDAQIRMPAIEGGTVISIVADPELVGTVTIARTDVNGLVFGSCW